MLPDDVIRAIAETVAEAEQSILSLLRDGRVADEPDITSRLSQAVELITRRVRDITVELTVVDSMGPGASENDLGADIVGVVRIALDDELRVSKGFLAQAKRDGSDGLRYRPTSQTSASGYSHWLYRNGLELEQSGTVELSRPSARLHEQCSHMLAVSPDAFVFVYHEDQLAVVSARAVVALRAMPAGRRGRTPLGTKRLDDFFVHVADCFIGDPDLKAHDVSSVKQLAADNRARIAMLLRVTGSLEQN